MKCFRHQPVPATAGRRAKLLGPSFLQSPPPRHATCCCTPRCAPLVHTPRVWAGSQARSLPAELALQRTDPQRGPGCGLKALSKLAPRDGQGWWAETAVGVGGLQTVVVGARRAEGQASWMGRPVVLTQRPQAVRAGMRANGAAGGMGLCWGNGGIGHGGPGT